MKLSLILFFSLIYINGYTQRNNICGKVEYQEYYQQDEPLYYILQFSELESIYESLFKIKEEGTIETIGGIIQPEIKSIYYNNLKEKELIFQEGIAFREVMTIDTIKALNWKIETETKEIGKYLCNKATTKFRGVDYVVWYTKQIPVSFGPWKFRGLEGLILECYDIKNMYHIQANKITIEKNCTNVIKKINKKNAISWYEYIELKKNEDKDIANYYNSLYAYPFVFLKFIPSMINPSN
ncbi:hypothetical protein B0A58_03750 [Flavobacterium branchiophilum NBRC 15030 = ATCC 35035]|uniref:GLPGLI family protein n=1 Tax=Flavobacterium branchiophilum TaxID=55197 RepID=A0A543G2L7_9FLAO|nr:GLPGLI family protein [Flavobacterium branchiophilum]OXA79236.1 hypothetical protein B0A58_03750 [Flavobacterium branchiophilum NBRC 15030 = ATCC 35035]TQM40274.1 GLPGLI family protein [Flavobacterium branchiophilum]GEM53971.1 hypothetical protein FB1_01920 [Flavobacterium branchiophilum NBRC 15030 = ATCC 35035]